MAGGLAAEPLAEHDGVPVALHELAVVDEIKCRDVGRGELEQRACELMKPRATALALPEAALVSQPSPAISEAGVP